jgi:hypothetical protein
MARLWADLVNVPGQVSAYAWHHPWTFVVSVLITGTVAAVVYWRVD